MAHKAQMRVAMHDAMMWLGENDEDRAPAWGVITLAEAAEYTSVCTVRGRGRVGYGSGRGVRGSGSRSSGSRTYRPSATSKDVLSGITSPR